MMSTSTATPFEPVLSATEAAQQLNIHPNTLLLWHRQGRIPAYRLGRRVVFRLSDLNVWLQENYTGQVIRAASTDYQEAA